MTLTAFEHAARSFEPSPADRWMYDPASWARDCIKWEVGEGLTFYQDRVLSELVSKRRVAVRGPHGLGKACSLDTMLPTPCGWTTIEDVQLGDQVLDENGKPCRVTGKSPIYLGPTYEVEFANGAVVTTHGEHEWNVIDIYHRPKTPRPNRRTIPVSDWRDHWEATRTKTTAYMAEQLRSRGGQLRWRVPVARPLDLPAVPLPVDPYTFGIWLGDGSSAGGHITLNREDSEHIVPRLPAGRFVPSGEKPSCRGYRIPGLVHQLRALDVLGDKHIPTLYLRASVEQRRELIRGLWDSDGYRQAGGSDEITLTNGRLASDVAELMRTLGLVVRVSQSLAKLDGRVIGPRWRIAARFDFNPYHLPRYGWEPRGTQASRHTQHTITDIRRVADQPTQCIEVDSPSHLYLTGESMIPTHNSTLAAFVVWWFATTRNAKGVDWKIITTASAWRQLQAYLWPEVHKWARAINWEALGRGPADSRRELLDLNLKFSHGAASAVASNDPAKIEGAHADSLLYIIDESKTVPVETWDAIEGAFSGGHTTGLPEAFALALSTPGQAAGRFYDIHTRKRGLEDWHPIHVTLSDAVKAGRISQEWADQRRRLWGADSAMYATRVLGEFHAGDDDALIPLSWVEAANERWHAWVDAGRPVLEGKRVIGVDVARTGSDESILAHRTGVAITTLQPIAATDTMAVVARVQAALTEAGEGTVAAIDTVGVGGGVYDRLRELGAKPLAYTGSGKTTKKDRTGCYGAVNVRSAAYWNLRELLNPAYDSELMLPPSDELTADLTTPKWDIVSGVPPKIKVETKDEVVKRLGRSPDRGDATAMAYWADAMHAASRLITAPKGRSFPTSSLSPLAR